LSFSPQRIVLTDLDPARVLAKAGKRALLVLPLLGTEAQVQASAQDWLRRLRAATERRAERARVEDLFARLVAWRLGTIDVLSELEEVMDITETATGRALIARGVAKGRAEGVAEGVAKGVARGRAEECRRAIAVVVGARLGRVPAWLPASLEAVTRLTELERVLRGAANVERAADVKTLLRSRSRGRGRAGSERAGWLAAGSGREEPRVARAQHARVGRVVDAVGPLERRRRAAAQAARGQGLRGDRRLVLGPQGLEGADVERVPVHPLHGVPSVT
jgi:hypothetical protein